MPICPRPGRARGGGGEGEGGHGDAKRRRELCVLLLLPLGGNMPSAARAHLYILEVVTESFDNFVRNQVAAASQV